jgi:hypothetical protein
MIYSLPGPSAAEYSAPMLRNDKKFSLTFMAFCDCIYGKAARSPLQYGER